MDYSPQDICTIVKVFCGVFVIWPPCSMNILPKINNERIRVNYIFNFSVNTFGKCDLLMEGILRFESNLSYKCLALIFNHLQLLPLLEDSNL